ncbi:HDIG domain-containing metalloprotein [Acetivibrio cellulolyticus]|uniref:HDIG domain-containing metalloprotein n=1 Tax=Acetivibrio cellulolyticus TaxID=35830 RepID=UPI0001E2E799|nr:HDIG domain-containing metalloprotein [Acetivibrio cellulolyticus]
MEREQALEELKGRLKSENLIKHSLSVEAIMKELAFYFKEDIDKWGMAGLLHDIDYDKTGGEPSKHGLVSAEILETLEVESSIVYAIKAHNDYHGIERKRKIDKALYCASPMSVLMTACIAALPSKELEDLTVEFVMDRISEDGFIKDTELDKIKSCEQLGISLEEFVEASIKAIRSI